MERFYQDDLASVHEVGFSELSRRAGQHVLDLLAASGVSSGPLVDLGCGSGAWAALASKSGFSVFGVDLSPAMVQLAGAAAGA